MASKNKTPSKADVKKIIYSMPSYNPENSPFGITEPNKSRGIRVYNVAQLVNQTGRDQYGRLVNWGFQRPFFYLSTFQRIDMVKLSSPVFGVITSRMQRISGMDFDIEPVKNEEDRIASDLKNLNSIYKERAGSLEMNDLVLKSQIINNVREFLPDIMMDLSNFDGALLRWKKKIQSIHKDKGDEIKDWMMEPNQGVSWEEYIKKVVYDLMTHGGVGIYKKSEHDRLENFDTLPGGTVYKMRAPTFSAVNAYVQIVPGIEPQVFFSNELLYMEYLPISSQNHSMIPLEALINKIAESLLFDKKMADQADGTKPPEKLIIITKNLGSFGGFDNPDEIPLDLDEQTRIEEKVNEPQKRGVVTFSGNGVEVVDLTGQNTMALQTTRQKDIREEVALVFNMSNMEVNLTSSDATSGRSTAEEQAEIEQGKGITPILQMIERKHTKEIITARYGSGYMMKFRKMRNPKEEAALDLLKQQTGEETVNELRERKNLPTFDGDEFNKPKGAGAEQELGTEMNPIITRNGK